MATIGMDFPQTREARKNILHNIIKNEDPITYVKVPSMGLRPVYRIPLTALSYNPHNTRFLAEAKTAEKRYGGDLSDENSEHVREIEKFIWENKKDKNENTIASLIKDGQLQAGVVTLDGIILSGNRRFRLLNEISRHKDKYGATSANQNGLEYFEAAIIDRELSKKEIVSYESHYQYGTEDKVDYNPIQKYIAAHEQKDMGFTNKEIAENFMVLTEGSEKIVKLWLEVYEIMDEYLDYIGESGIYTALEGQEESFLRLRIDLNSLSKGKTGARIWAYSELDLIEFKQIFFDYIRTGKSTHEFRIFKNIFEDGNRWKAFCREVRKVVTDNDIPSFEEYRNSNEDINESEISKIRNNDYAAKVKDKLNALYGNENAKIIGERIQEKPLEIVKDIQDKLSKLEILVNNNHDSDVYITDIFIDSVRDIQSRIGKIKQNID